MSRDTADYEDSEAIAIAAGKEGLQTAPWLFDRNVEKANGFFFEMRENNRVHPDHYAIHTVDGIGTKIFLSGWSNEYRQAPQDAVAMDANDFAPSIHGMIDAVTIYCAAQQGIEQQHMGEIMEGFAAALKKLRIPEAPFNPVIGKIETATLDEMISVGVPNKGWDVGVAINGFIEKSKVPNLQPQPGHYIVGVASTGMHSNGFTGARHVLLTPDVEYRKEWKDQYKGKFQLDDRPDILEGQTILEALQEPTALYYADAIRIGQAFDNRDIYGVNITGNGLENFNRAGEDVSFEITEEPLEPLPIHKLLVEESGWDPKTAYKKQNMGMGFAYVAPTQEIAEGIVEIVNRRKERAKIIGQVAASSNTELITRLHKPYEGPKLGFIGYTN